MAQRNGLEGTLGPAVDKIVVEEDTPGGLVDYMNLVVVEHTYLKNHQYSNYKLINFLDKSHNHKGKANFQRSEHKLNHLQELDTDCCSNSLLKSKSDSLWKSLFGI